MKPLIAVALILMLSAPTLAQTATPTITLTPSITYTPSNTPTPMPTARRSYSCGSGLPCGPIPWQVPRFPILESPTPIPTLFFTSTPTPTLSPTPTATLTPVYTPTITPIPSNTPTPLPTATSTAVLDTSFLNDQLATVQALAQATPIEFVDYQGTPVDSSGVFVELGDNAGAFFGYVRGAASNGNFGKITPLFTFVIATMSIVFFVKLTLFLLPLVGTLFGVMRKIVTFFLDFIPG